MRGLFYPLVMLIVSLVVLVGLVFVRPQAWWPEGPRNVSQLLQLSAPATPIPAAKPAAITPEPRAAKPGTATKGLVRDSQSRPVEARGSGADIAVPTPPPARKFPFPTAEQIGAGSSQTMILASFGRPEVRVTGAETGEIRERYVYVDRQTGRKTYIAMVNAKVTSVQTFNP